MWMFSMQNTSDYNANHLVSNPGTITLGGEQYTPNYYSTPVNLDGYWNLRTHLSYGFPIGFLKSNFNVMAGVNFTKTPSMLGGTVDSDVHHGRRAQRHQEYRLRLPHGTGQQHFGERGLYLRGPAPITRRPTRWANRAPRTVISTIRRRAT